MPAIGALLRPVSGNGQLRREIRHTVLADLLPRIDVALAALLPGAAAGAGGG